MSKQASADETRWGFLYRASLDCRRARPRSRQLVHGWNAGCVGESLGQFTTVGHLESRDVIAAREFLRQILPKERVAAIGVSLGAASITLANGQASFDAVVLESMYPTISEPIEDRLRLRLGAAGTLLAPLLTLQLQPRLGIDMDQLRPIEHIAALGAPLLLIHGTEDRHTLIDEARTVFARAAEPKELWEVPKAPHVDLHRFGEDQYEQRVGEFLSRYLSTAPAHEIGEM